MSVERKLSKAEETMVLALVEKRNRAQQVFQEVQAGITELGELIRLGKGIKVEGQVQFDGREDGVYLVVKPRSEIADAKDMGQDEAQSDEKG